MSTITAPSRRSYRDTVVILLDDGCVLDLSRLGFKNRNYKKRKDVRKKTPHRVMVEYRKLEISSRETLRRD